eukprot:EG_transcript_7586
MTVHRPAGPRGGGRAPSVAAQQQTAAATPKFASARPASAPALHWLAPFSLFLAGAAVMLQRRPSVVAAWTNRPVLILGLVGERQRTGQPLLAAAADDVSEGEDAPETEDERQPDPTFARLVEQTDVVSRVVLLPVPEVDGKGLFTVAPVEPGTILLKVPLFMCITEPISPDAETSSSLAVWERRLVQRLLQALMTEHFWNAYRPLLPSPSTMGHPLLLPPPTVRAIQHTVMEAAILDQQEALWRTFPDERPDYEDEDLDWPPDYLYALALVRSRAVQAGDDRYALVPFLDMANHSDTPNAAWQFDGQTFRLTALQALPARAEVTIQYHPAMDSRQRFIQYGFVTKGGNPHDRLPGMEKVKAAGQVYLTWPSFRAFLLGKGLDPAQPATLPNAVVAVMQSLPFREAAGQAREKEVEAAAELCLALHSLASTEFPSTVDSDIQQLKELLRAPEEVGPMEVTVLSYRIERKAFFQLAIDLLTQYQRFLLVPPGSKVIAKKALAKDR